jgi:hypothetical protein
MKKKDVLHLKKFKIVTLYDTILDVGKYNILPLFLSPG